MIAMITISFSRGVLETGTEWGGIFGLYDDALGQSHVVSGQTDCRFLLVAPSARYWSAHNM